VRYVVLSLMTLSLGLWANESTSRHAVNGIAPKSAYPLTASLGYSSSFQKPDTSIPIDGSNPVCAIQLNNGEILRVAGETYARTENKLRTYEDPKGERKPVCVPGNLLTESIPYAPLRAEGLVPHHLVLSLARGADEKSILDSIGGRLVYSVGELRVVEVKGNPIEVCANVRYKRKYAGKGITGCVGDYTPPNPSFQ
jgi:hypothetical protein